jgi:hypothetical protein
MGSGIWKWKMEMSIDEFDSRVCSHRAGLIRKYGVCEPIPFVRYLDMENIWRTSVYYGID